MRRLLTFAVAFTLAGCKTRPYDPVDAAVADLAPVADLAAGPDGCAAYKHHYLVPVALDSLTAVDDISTLGRAIRVRVGVPLRGGCDVLGAIDVVGSGNYVAITAHRWFSANQVCGPPVVVERVLVISDDGMLSGPFIKVVDSVGGMLSVPLATGVAPPGCAPALFGGPCDRDCQCAGTQFARCVERGGGNASCEVPCNESVDCVAAGLSSCGAGPPQSTCSLARGCGSDGDCGFGQRCDHGGCIAAQKAVADKGCGCDADCGFGGLCKLTVDLGYCVIPCTTDADCTPDKHCNMSQCLK